MDQGSLFLNSLPSKEQRNTTLLQSQEHIPVTDQNICYFLPLYFSFFNESTSTSKS